MSFKIKKLVLNLYVRSNLLYGSEFWKITDEEENEKDRNVVLPTKIENIRGGV